MTNWSLQDEDSFDFSDPNEAAGTPAPATGSAEPKDAAGDTETGEVDLSEAISDDSGAVHVWFDEEHRVQHVRLSNRWRERLKDSKLEVALRLALHQGQFQLRAFPSVSADPVDAPSALSADAVERLSERASEVLDKQRKLEAGEPAGVTSSYWKGEQIDGTSQNRMVTVTLDIHGDTAKVGFDQDWLTSVKAADLGQAIVEAHEDAYSRWTRPDAVMGEFGVLAAQHLQIRDEALAMLKRGV